MAARFDRFSEQARQVLTMAQLEAQRFGQRHIDGEHILLGLIAPPANIAVRALIGLGADPERVRLAVEAKIGRGAAAASEIGLTMRAKRAIERAVAESRRLNHQYIGPEHLLLGLTLVEDGIASEILRELGVRHHGALSQVMMILSSGGDARPQTGWFGYAPLAANEPLSPELREALE